LSRRTAIKIVKSIPGVEVIEEKIRDDAFCTFKLGDRIFEIWEPFGDNSRYHISERPITDSNELEVIKESFSDFKPGLLALFHG
jgi:hypothetical protein